MAVVLAQSTGSSAALHDGYKKLQRAQQLPEQQHRVWVLLNTLNDLPPHHQWTQGRLRSDERPAG